MSAQPIWLSGAQQSDSVTQLYEHLELYSDGDPSRNTLFVLGRADSQSAGSPQLAQDQLLLIDPPDDAQERFRLEGDVAALFTGTPRDIGLAQLATVPGGVAHIRIGEHFLDIYSQHSNNIVTLPALGIVCSASFGSDHSLPVLGPRSDGSYELDTLRLLARLVKQQNLQLLIPNTGTLTADRMEAMSRLAANVAYLHGLRRALATVDPGGDTLAAATDLAESLLPEGRRNAAARSIHNANIIALLESAS